MSGNVLKCQYEEGNINCAFMPTSLDSRSHDKLRFKQEAAAKTDQSSSLLAKHPQNSRIKVEGTRLQSKNYKYAVGVYEEGSRKIHLYEATAFSVQALVDGGFSRAAETGSEPTASYLDKKKDLINTYAPVKKQRQLRAAVNAIVSDEKMEGYAESREVMKQSIADSMEEKSNALAQPTGIIGQMRELLPPFDLSATSADLIFNFTTLFPDSVVSAIDPTDSESVCHALFEWINEGFRSPASDDPWAELKGLRTLSQLGRLYLSAKQERRKTFSKLLSILVSMMQLYKLKRSKSWTHCDIYASEALAQTLGELFSPDKVIGGAIDREGANKLFAHLVLFVLRLTPFWEFDFADLKIDLNLQSKDLLSILSFAGVNVRNKSGLVGKLTAPLTVQPAGGGYGKRGKGTPKRKN